MKILLVVNSLNFGGAERQAIELAKGLSERHSVEIVTLASPGGGYTSNVEALGIPFHSFPRRSRLDLWPIGKLAALIRTGEFDIVQGFMGMGSLYGMLAARLTRRPVVCSAIRDARLKSGRERVVTRFLSAMGDALVANSKAGLLSRFPVPKEHHRVIYNGIDFKRLEESTATTPHWLTELHLEDYSHRVGMVASLSKHRDHTVLVESAAQVIEAFPKVQFLLVGDGSERARLEQLADSLGVTGNLFFTGYQADSDLVYRQLDLAVLLTNTDIVDEGTSNALIEAMGSGLPVVATNCGATPEVVEDEVHGLLVSAKSPEETAAAIVRLLGDRSLSKGMGEAGRLHVHRLFGHRRYSLEYEELYRSLLRNS